MEDTRDKIRKITKNYIKLFPEDYSRTKAAIKDRRSTQINKWGDTKVDVINRKLGEFPELLYGMIIQGLTEQEINHWKSDPAHEVSHWFFREFPEFRTTEKI